MSTESLIILTLNKIGPYYTSYAVFITSQVEKRETKASLKQATVLLIAWQITFGSTARKSSTLFGKCVSLPLAQRRVGRSVLLSFGGAADRLAWMRRESARGYERCLRQRLYFPTVSDVELGL